MLDWLPEIVSTDGDPREVYKYLYDVFLNDFVNSRPNLRDAPIFWDRTIKEGRAYPEGFYHLVEIKRTPNSPKDDRIFDPRRAERIKWFRAIIDNVDSDEVLCFDYQEKEGKVNTYLWLKDYDYLAVFQRKSFRIGPVYFLVTAFYVDGESKRRNLLRKYRNCL